MSEPTKREESIFDGALQLPEEQRAEYVAMACGGEAELRQRVEMLLRSHAQSTGILDKPARPATQGTMMVAMPLTEKPGDRIGCYKLLQQIGEGGCGVVYMAEQEKPVVRRVALKVIKLGMDSKSVVARFEAERQALAMMDHPNIAKVLDAGATELGRPFFVMELVRGIRITDYCNQNRLATEERLKLFIQVCHAIQHAHQKGIIHRDIKPSNILVTMHDGVAVPKVIDFGIAKATQGRLTDQTLFTAFEQFIGTPAYMSPEQAEMSGLDIDTRCDVYALGVLLYELLTGQTPFDAKKLIEAGLDKMRQTIREEEPQRPSTRLQTMMDADLTVTASHCRTEPPRLISLLRGDLDWIVMKALEKDRTRRFETASAFGMDVQRFLENQPVEARPPSTVYRFQKLVRRNKLAVGAAAAVFAALVLGLGVSMSLYVKERAARQRADAAEAEQSKLRAEAEMGLKLAAEKIEHAKIGELIGVGALYLTQEKYVEAEKLITQVPMSVLTNYVSTAFLFNVFAARHARLGEWAQAMTNFERVITIVPGDFPGYHLLAPLLAQAGTLDAYRKHGERMRQIFAKANDTATECRLARDELLLPPAAGDLETICQFADKAVAAGPSDPTWNDLQFVKGLAEYRRGNYAGAAEWLQKIVPDPKHGNWNQKVAISSVLAMAQFHLNQMETARATLKATAKMAGDKMDDLRHGLDNEWNDWVTAQILLREAHTLVEGASPTAKED